MDTDFKHIFVPGDLRLPVLLLLHGTGGGERDFLEIGQSVSPGSAILSVRGKVSENGMPRFFRRLAEGVFDLEDLKFRTEELSDFIVKARRDYDLGACPIVALGYSNGANISASILLARPDVLSGAILLRAMMPFEPETLPDLRGKKIQMLSGLMDNIIPADNSVRLAEILKKAGADVSFSLKPAGHGLTQSDLSDMKHWMGTLAF